METEINEIFENCLQLQSSAESEQELSKLGAQAGLILFADSQDTPILLLACANIRRNAKNKLAEQIEPTKKADLKSITTKIYYKTYPCKFRLAIAHWQAVRKIFGQNYKNHITFVWPAYIKINPNEKIPSFSITRKPASKNGEKNLGPVPGQRAATAFLKAIEDAFRLCKRNDLVGNLEQAKSCPYIQMDACSGVCGGKTSSQDYRNIIKDAFEAGANPKEAIEKLKGQMRVASAELSFEKAAVLKKKIEKLSVLTKQRYRWTGDLEKLKIIHIDKVGKVKVEDSKKKKQTYAVFVMNFGRVIDLGDFLLDDADAIIEAIDKGIENLCVFTGDTNESAERFSIVSYFLYRSKPTGLWINANEGISQEELVKLKNED